MKLMHGPGTCSLGILVLIEELGLDCEIQRVNLRAGEQRTPEFLAINPKGKVPALVLDDGAVVTEWAAIATYLAKLKPEAGLLPDAPLAAARVMEATDYIVSSVHMLGFSRIMRPVAFSPDEASHEAVQAQGRAIFDAGLTAIGGAMGGAEYVAGEFSIADAALFYCERWTDVMLKAPLPPGCDAHYRRMLARPGIARALERDA